MKQRSIIRVITMVAGIAVSLNVMTASAFAARPIDTDPPPAQTEVAGDPTPPSAEHEKYECPDEENLNNVTGHGANNNDGYQSTCDEADFGGNGQEFGPGLQTGKPCAGCVGAADDKNPPGQYPDGSDHNSGYECDGRDRPFENQNGNGNHGIGDENPAHTGCNSTTTPPPELCPDGSPMPAGGVEDCETGDPELCPDGSPMPAGGVEDCETGEPELCPDGSPMPPEGGDCGQKPETCPDGSPMPPAGGNCGQTETCPDGSEMPAGGVEDCDEGDETCPDGSEMPAGGVEDCDEGDETCPDGSEMPAGGVEDCDEGDETCPDGSPMPPAGGNCGQTETCPDGSEMPAGGVEDCDEVDDDDVVKTCPDGSPMPPTGSNCGHQDDDDTPPFTCPVNTTVKDNGDSVMDGKDCVTDVEGLTIIGPTTPSSVDERTPQVLGTELVAAPETVAVLDAEPVGPTSVLGVQVERAAVAPAALARTGASNNTGVLVLFAGLLLALGFALVQVGGRRPAAI